MDCAFHYIIVIIINVAFYRAEEDKLLRNDCVTEVINYFQCTLILSKEHIVFNLEEKSVANQKSNVQYLVTIIYKCL